MANALVCVEQGIQIRDWPTPTTVHGITAITAALDTGEVTGAVIDVTFAVSANQAQRKAALQTSNSNKRLGHSTGAHDHQHGSARSFGSVKGF